MRASMIVLLIAACGSSISSPAPGDREVAEFAGSYPEVATPTGVVRTFDLVAEPTELPLVDGKLLKVWAYNGQVPGPTFRIKLGETIRVKFTNKLPQATTVHWHGVRLPNAMDGVPGITQEPIEPGATFVYEFTPKDAGTFWFHPHLRASEQIERGLYGVLVVEDVAPLPYSREVVWVLDDWLLDSAGQIAGTFNTRHDLAMDGRWGNAITVNGRTLPKLEVRPGERIRLRILDSANGRLFVPDFGELDAKIIAVDGLYLRTPIAARGFEIAPGNRIDIDIAFDRSTSDPAMWDRFNPQRPTKLATFEIAGELVDTPRFSPPSGHVPVWAEALQIPAVHDVRLNAAEGGAFGIAWSFDGKPMDTEHHHHAMEPLLTLDRDKFVRVHFTNESARIHPIHTHGMFFRLLARNGAPVDEPFFRDTVVVHGREQIDIGVVPTDAGRWMMHCHILEHAESGMMTTIEVRDLAR